MSDTSTPLFHATGCPCCAPSSTAATNEPQPSNNAAPSAPSPSDFLRIGDFDLRALLDYRKAQAADGTFSNGLTRWNADMLAGQGLTAVQALNSNIGVGTPVTLNYHFATALPSYFQDGGVLGAASSFRPLSADEKKIVLEELKKISDVTGVKFVESPSAEGKTLSFAVTDMTDSAAGRGYYPTAFATSGPPDQAGVRLVNAVAFVPQAGDVYLDRSYADGYANGGLSAGERAAMAGVIRHEIGHALGLSHTTDGAVTLPSSGQSKFLSAMGRFGANDDVIYGIDNGAYLRTSVDTLGVLDILALQHLYGANTTYKAADDTYSWDEKVGFNAIIYDAGGTDTIDLSSASMQSWIDLTAETASSINMRITESERLVNTPRGWVDTAVTYTGKNNLGIIGTIENVKAGSGNDRVNGNASANDLRGGVGNDSIWGGGGDDRLFLGSGNDRVVAGSGNDYVDGGRDVDVAGLFGPRSSYSIARQADGSLKVVGPEGTGTYLNMEFLAFNDGGKVGLWMNADVKLGGGFDETFYLAKNPDVAAAVARGALSSGFAHYVQWGQAEGRVAVDARTDPLYDELGYLAKNPDVAAAVESGALRSGWEHYQAYGKAEGRIATLLFDRDYYLAKNADVAAAKIDPWFHFMNYGWKEGRDPSAYLDVSAYLDANADLKTAGVNPLAHYAMYGQGEGRLLVATSDLGLDWTYLG